MRRLTHAELMAFHDGELEPEQLARVEEALERDPEARALLSQLGELGDLVRENARSVPSPDLADAVLARAQLDGVRPDARPQPDGELDVRSARRALVTGASILAMAAAALLWLSTRAPAPDSGDQGKLASGPGASESGAVTRPSVAPHARIEPGDPLVEPTEVVPSVSVQSVDFGARNGSIFLVDGKERPVLVVWVVDPPQATSRIQPL